MAVGTQPAQVHEPVVVPDPVPVVELEDQLEPVPAGTDPAGRAAVRLTGEFDVATLEGA